MAFVQGYTLFLPGRWDTATFFFSYTMLGVVPLLFAYYKLRHRTKVSVFSPFNMASSYLVHSQFADLASVNFFRNERAQVDRYEAAFKSEKTQSQI
jgi:yeast amino acid transporter